ncbi:MAG: type VI secretion system baseplate subunit TssK [Acidobacteria bacterium]|nr:type VI secretion system baseplate subunit TssK [Acidobacteriota bacterium]
MRYLSRVVWSEGMYLGPHQFQAQNRYFEDSLDFAVSSLWFEPWGLAGCELDAEALFNGTLSLVHARGIFPDGLSFNMPECDPPPAALPVTELFPPVRDYMNVALALPARKLDGLNCALEEGQTQAARYVAETRVLHDETTGRDEKPVKLGRKNIRFLLDVEPAEDLVTLPVARIRRDGAGRFVFDEAFVPPCLTIRASQRLMMILRRLIDILEEKSATLGAAKRTGGRSWAEYSTRDIANFWMLHTVNAALAPLRHMFYASRGHPEELYFELARLAGGLCTFALESHPKSVPLYNHKKLDECFEALDHMIRTHLETIVPTNCLPIPLTKTGDYFYEGTITDQRCTGPSRWVFAIQSPIGEAELLSRTPALVKICSKIFTPELAKRALPGLALTHLPVPPSAISTRADTQYFGISKAGPCWDHMVKTKQIAVYIPGELPDPKPELLVVVES